MSTPVGVKLAMPCPYCHNEIYCTMTKKELKLVMRGFKLRTDKANMYISMKVDQYGTAYVEKKR